MTDPSDLSGTTLPERPRLGSAGLPLLVAALSVAFLARQNLDRGFWPADLVLPFGVAVVTAILVWIPFRLVGREPALVALGSGLVVTILLFGGRVEQALLAWFIYPGMLHWTVVLLALGVFPALVLIRIWGEEERLAVPARVVEMTCLILVLVTGVPLVASLAQRADLGGDPVRGSDLSALPTDAPEERPDIFLIVPDAFSGPSSLQSGYGLDIGPFVSDLAELGFHVPPSARSNYAHTFLAMVSMLNWNYLQDDPMIRPASGEGWGARSELYPYLHQNRTIQLAREAGYRIVFVSSPYPPLQGSRTADEILAPPAARGELEATWIEQTAFNALDRAFCRGSGACGRRLWVQGPFRADSAPAQEWRFRELARVADGSTVPTFYYVHLLVPHGPFVFGPECEHREPVWPQSPAAAAPPAVRDRYSDQVQCVTRLLLESIREILRSGRGDPVIIIQSDHGYGRMVQSMALDEAPADLVRERMDGFAAYRLPEGYDLVLPDTVTPINAMRAVISEVFGMDLPPLEDRSYWSTFRDPFDFVELPPALLQGSGPDGG